MKHRIFIKTLFDVDVVFHTGFITTTVLTFGNKTMKTVSRTLHYVTTSYKFRSTQLQI